MCSKLLDLSPSLDIEICPDEPIEIWHLKRGCRPDICIAEGKRCQAKQTVSLQGSICNIRVINPILSRPRHGQNVMGSANGFPWKSGYPKPTYQHLFNVLIHSYIKTPLNIDISAINFCVYKLIYSLQKSNCSGCGSKVVISYVVSYPMSNMSGWWCQPPEEMSFGISIPFLWFILPCSHHWD